MLRIFQKKFRTISKAEAKKRLDTGNALLLDVRTPEEYRQIHIPNSISLPLDQLKTTIQKIARGPETELIVYCQSGMRAARACAELAEMGYTNLSSMGGIDTWPYETERGD